MSGPLFPSELHAHTRDSACLTAVPGAHNFKGDLVIQADWFQCGRYGDSPVGEVHFHGDRAARHVGGERTCPLPVERVIPVEELRKQQATP